MPTVMVDVAPQQPRPEWPHQKAHRKNSGRVQTLGLGAAVGEKDRRGVQGESRVSIPIVPHHQVANGAANDETQPGVGCGSRKYRNGHKSN